MDTVHRNIKVLEETYLDLEFTAGSFFYHEVHHSVISTRKTVKEANTFEKSRLRAAKLSRTRHH